MKLYEAAQAVYDAYVEESPVQRNKLANSLSCAIQELVHAIENPEITSTDSPVTTFPPPDQWNVLLEHKWNPLTYDVYLFYRDSKTRETLAYSGNGKITIVREGVEMPIWLEVTEQLLEEVSFIDAFKNVYVKETVWRKSNPT